MSIQLQDDHAEAEKSIQERALSEEEYALSLLTAMQTSARWGQCYHNAYAAFFAIPALFEPHGQLVEGWIVFEDALDRVVLMEHGWLISNKRDIIDPTIAITVEFGRPVYYFPGVFRGRTELEALEDEFFPHVCFSAYGEDGLQHEGYRAAYDQALQKARSLLAEGRTFTEVRAKPLTPEEEALSAVRSGFRIIAIDLNEGETYGE